MCEEVLKRRNEARLKWLADTINQLNEDTPQEERKPVISIEEKKGNI